MDDERDIGLGALLSGAAGGSEGRREPDFRAVYAEAGLRQGRRQAMIAGLPVAAALFVAVLVPALAGTGGTGIARNAGYRSVISDLSSRTVSDTAWEYGAHAAGAEGEESALGEFMDDLWNL